MSDSRRDGLTHFLSDLEEGMRQASRGDLATPQRVAEIERRMARAGYVGKHFDNPDFRAALLYAFHDLRDDANGPEGLAAYEALSPEAAAIAMEVMGDFAQLLLDAPRVEECVNEFVKQREFGKALKIVRENAPYMDRNWTMLRISEIWDQIAQIHPELQPIANTFFNGQLAHC